MKNKILIIFLLIITLISFATVSFCSYDVELDGQVFKLPDWLNSRQYKFFAYSIEKIKNVYTVSVCVVSSDSPLCVSKVGDRYDVRALDGSKIFSNGSYGSFLEENLTFDYSDFSEPSSPSSSSSFYSSDNVIVYTNYDVVDMNSGEVVFPRTPVSETLEPMTIQSPEEIQQMIIKLVTAILPVILTIVGVFLVIYLMRYKIFSHL